MSVLVDRKKPASFSGGKPPSRSTAALKGSRESQKEQGKQLSSASVPTGGAATAVPAVSKPAPGVEQMNLMAIQRVDSHVLDLLSTVPQVVLYQYEEESNTWERTSTEGTLFIYNRDASPRHGVVLLNRLSSDNLLEMVEAGSEYRVQGVFVLFKKHADASGIYGLCFNEASVCTETGQLLASLSSQARVSNTVVPLAPGMRSQSVPVFPPTHTQDPLSSSGGERTDILEVLEGAGSSYLNQVFSDDTGGSSSQESPPSEGITFSAHQLTASRKQQHQHHHHREKGRGASDDDKSRSSLAHSAAAGPPVSAKHQRGGGGGGGGTKEKKVFTRSSSPRSIPKSGSSNYNSNAVVPSRSLSSQDASRGGVPHSQTQWNGGRDAPVSSSRPRQSAGSPRNTAGDIFTASSSSTPRQEAKKPPLRSATAPSHVVSGASPNSKKTRSRQAGLSRYNPQVGPLEEVLPEQPIVRKLFNPESAGDSSRGGGMRSTSLQNLFSESLPPLATLGGDHVDQSASSKPPCQPMSLAEIEKQMKEEVPSPDTTKIFSLLTASSSSSSATTTHTAPTASDSLSASLPDGARVLLQPSAFSVNPPTTGVAAAAPPNSHYSVTGNQNNYSFSLSSSSSVQSASTDTARTVTFSVEPPSPVVSRQPTLSPTTRSSHSVFPGIPPLMPSPGMRAPPVTSSSATIQPSQAAQKQSTASAKGPKEAKGAHGREGGEVAGGKGGGGGRGGGRGGKGSRGGSRSPGRSGTPEKSLSAPSPQPGLEQGDGAAMNGSTPARTMSVPSNMSPMSVMVPSQPATLPHTLLSPQQFSTTPDSSTHTDTHSQPPLSRDHFKQALIHLIQNDDDFISQLHHAYHLSVMQQQQQ